MQKIYSKEQVKAGYLTSDFQPKGNTDLHTLKILGFAIGEELKLAPRYKWSHFEELWNIDYANKLSSVPISAKQYQRAKTLMDLYPEVDFNLLIKPCTLSNKSAQLVPQLSLRF